jgi:glycosyltransferase involved in cell wall biosynthesis
MASRNAGARVTLVGHVFSRGGRGEDVRAAYRALKAAGIHPSVVDIFRVTSPDEDVLEELWDGIVEEIGDGINIYFINADEVATVLSHLRTTGRFSGRGYNVVYPVWELARYPVEWARELDKFDEIWVPTLFIYDSIASKARAPVRLLPFASGLPEVRVYGREEFGISADSYAFLFLFDFASYVERKNPLAVIDAFGLFLRKQPTAKAKLVLKLSGVNQHEREYEELRRYIVPVAANVTLLDRLLNSSELAALFWCCDCYISLHRSEGFGRGLAEAMSLGKPVIATDYSGNVDFMNERNSLLVGYHLVAVPEGCYPFGSEQVWAEPNAAQAARYMKQLVDDPALGRMIGEQARKDLFRTNGYSTVGNLYRERIAEIEHMRRELLEGVQE